jgi:hypothetical protein
VESLCDKAIWGSLDAAEGSLGKSFEEFWTSKHGECAPNSVVILKVPNKSGRGA